MPFFAFLRTTELTVIQMKFANEMAKAKLKAK